MSKFASVRSTRRKFLRRAIGTVAAGFNIVPRHVLGGPGFVPPSETVNIALIGCGGQGRSNARALFDLPDVKIIAVADPVDSQNLDAFYYKGLAGRLPMKAEIEKRYSENFPDFKAADFKDFRVMLEKEKAIDAILCATPDHLHAYVSATAIRLGKHVYCEKPLTHNVWEARQVARIARETGVATQMGNQGHAGETIRQTCELIWQGTIGAVREVHAWTAATRWNQGLNGRPADEAVPAGVDWDLWLGPRAARAYSSAYNAVRWRDFWDFGTAPIGDFFCHNFDPALWALDLREPLSIEASAAGPVDSYIAPAAGLYTYHFGPRGDQPAVKFNWYEGGLRPALPEVMGDGVSLDGNGILFVGDKGVLTSPGWGGRTKHYPLTGEPSYPRAKPTLTRVKGHHRDWIDACKGGPPAGSNFEYGAALSEVGLLGLVAMRVGKKLHWDAPGMKATNAPEADAFLKETYRPGWGII